MQIIKVDGSGFNDINTFYDEAQRKLCPEFVGFGRNLDALNDVLRGGFGKFEYEETIKIAWNNSAKSEKELGDSFNKIIEIIKSHKHITLELH